MDKIKSLSKDITLTDFKKFYWDKKELIHFCKQNKIPTQGSKIELSTRIAHYLDSGGEITHPQKISRQHPWDSSNTITADTAVINYRNDAETRKFFVSQIGDKFKFNHYLREFAKQENDGSLSYADLVKGWLYTIKKITIDKQFEYNQFQRDFYKNEIKNTREECNAAWKFIKSMPGESTYQQYLKLINL